MSPLNHESLLTTANELLPETVVRLCDLFADPEYSMGDVVETVNRDPSLAARLLSLAGSPMHSTGNVKSTKEAVARLGSETVRSIAIATNARPRSDLDLSAFGLTTTSYWRHNVAVLTFAEELAAQRVAEFGDGFSTAALLHDFGKLVLSEHLTSAHRVKLRDHSSGLSGVELETRTLGINHAEVTAAVARSWNLQDELIQAVQYHHKVTAFDHPMCHGLNIANQLAWQMDARCDALECESENRSASMAALDLTEKELQVVRDKGVIRMHKTMSVYF